MNKRKRLKNAQRNAPATPNRALVMCRTAVNRDAVRRETIDGVEHIVVTSFTLPDDVVMNGGLYPADEIAAGFETLEGTLAPVEHPVDSDGNFLSANDAIAINNFHVGAWNQNVTREDGRVKVEKWINVAKARETEKGRRLLDRINELEESSDPRPVHTSVGVFIAIEQTDGPKTNAAGDEYTWIAREMVFDHDAILLDSVGAAQPHQGVGMGINSAGQKVAVHCHELPATGEGDRDGPAVLPERLQANAEGMSLMQLREQLEQAVTATVALDWVFAVDIFEDTVVFESNAGFLEVPYRVDDGSATIVGIPVRVDRVVTYTPKTNSAEEADPMRELILNALKAAGVETEGKSDDELFAAYNALNQGNENGDSVGAEAIEAAVANALKPLSERLDQLEQNRKSEEEAEAARLAGVVVNSGKYPGLDEESAKVLPLANLQKMAANCGASYGVPLAINSGSQSEPAYKPTELPE